MPREIITLNVGQAGCQLGHNVWKQYCAEHKINESGFKEATKLNDESYRCFYQETDSGNYVARNLFVDLEPNVIDDVRSSLYSKIYDEHFLLNKSEDAANCFARGHYTVGKEIIDEVNDRIRKQFDLCDNCQGFIFNHSVGGGTGSGLGSLILERLAVDYRKKSKFSFDIYPSPTISTCVVEPYNALLTTHWLLDHTEVSVMLDNEAIYEICQKKLKIKRPDYNDINGLISKPISSITRSLRFEGELQVDLNEFQTNLVPFPRLHFILTSMAPIVNKSDAETTPNDVQGMAEACFSKENFFVKIADFDAEEDKYMAISVNFSGDVKAKEANATVQWLKTNKKVSFVEWCPTGFKVGMDDFDDDDDDTIGLSVGGAKDVNQFRKAFEQMSSSKVEKKKNKKTEHFDAACAPSNNTEIAAMKRSLVMMGNNTAISRVFCERISKKYDLMYSQRAFVHWYVSEGMEEGEFAEAREDLGFLEKDYLDVLSEQATDEYDDDDSDYDDDNIGLAVGGAKDVNNFRQHQLQNNGVPPLDSITYNGILYEYYFDTKTRKSVPKTRGETDEKKDETENKNDNSKLFYPSYCYAKVKKLDFSLDGKDNESDDEYEYEYYMSVGLNCNIKKNEFKRKNLNIIIILDRSGSMWRNLPNEYGSTNKSRMQVAVEASVGLLQHLTPNDRFGFIAFDDNVEVIQKLQMVKDINMDQVKQKILKITAGGENEFCDAYKKAVSFYDKLFKDDTYNGDEYENRIMFLTDAQIHIGCSDPNLLKYVKNDAEQRKKNRIYTTFIGIGLDFYAHLCEEIASVRGCNYYSVKTVEDFILKMEQEFEFMVTPLVFNVCLKLKCEGNVCEIEKVYGTRDKKTAQIMETGEITKIGTLFPTLKSKKKGGTKGGIQIIKLKKNNNELLDDNMNVELEVTYEDRNGNKFKNSQLVTFNPPKLYAMNDMIDDNDDDGIDQDDYERENFYDNLGIQKGILLCKYVELLRSWIQSSNKFKYKSKIFPKFLKYFEKEMIKCKDDQLQNEVDIIKKIITN